ncbi:hypothetical protein LAZ67_6003153 [Cordylochernes scorpioides]|uniref:ATP-dependent DNA helicase n=1 Tax=Cordylochernes scorpioides TaxID=51811 RepID=A0ABY6KLQ7_9ARAC|nr:hypothetical protein LAZ67_6003153 [Cordylochernes scorpioides]
MPRKRSAIRVRTPAARRMAARAARGQNSRTLENPQQSQARLQSDQLRHIVQRTPETPQQSQTRQEADRLRHFRQRASTWADMLNAAFHFNPALNYEQFTFLQIGYMDKQCLHCTAFRYNGERPGMCCSAGKVRIPDLPEPPEALRTLIDGSSPHSAEFMQRVRHYNNAFQMTSFGCGSPVVLPGYMSTFKVQGQVYHRIGSVLPSLNSDSRQLQPAFLQVFFIGESSAEVATRHRNFSITKPHIVSILQDMLHRHNPYVHLFKASIEKMPSPDYKLVIKADKAPPGHHPRTFNAPTINKVAIVIRINEFHRSYDALQYPLVFWNGQDGYHFHIPHLIDGVPSAHKTVSCMDFYAPLLMIRSRNPGITNWLLAFGNLTHLFLVDIYAKVESERLHYISAHQAQLRATEYIHLLDAIRTDRSHALIGRQVILPSSFVGSPRHMHDYAQELHGLRPPDEDGFSSVKRVRVFTIENGFQVVRMTNVTIDNRYLVPYWALLCRLFDAHTNVEVYTVHPNFAEFFYLRMLLHSVLGPTSFAALKTINGVLCQTYKDACLHLGLLENDQQWHHCIQEAVLSESPLKIRELFAIILTCCHPTNPQYILAQFKEPMSADILNLARQQANDGLLQLAYEMSNQALILLEQKVLQMSGFHLTKFGMRSPQRNVTHRTSHQLLGETSYDLSRLLQFVASNEPKLANVPEQKVVYERILSKIDSNAGGLTAHSTFKLPLDLTRDEVSVCNLNADSAMGEVSRQCKFIVLDECSMAHRHALEAVDITLKDCRQDQRPMGGVVLLLAGDFRQILPIIPREATILTGCFQNEEVFIPRIPMIDDDEHSSLHFKRLQFPIRVSFAMSINKAQDASSWNLCLFISPLAKLCRLPPRLHGRGDIEVRLASGNTSPRGPKISQTPPSEEPTGLWTPREEDSNEDMESDPEYESGENTTFPKIENTLGSTQKFAPSQEDATPPPVASDVLGSLARTLHQLSAATGLSRDVDLPRYDGSYEAQSFFDNYDAQADRAQLQYTERLRRLPNLLQESLTEGVPVADQRIVAAVQPNTLQELYRVVSRVRGTHSVSQVCQLTTRTTPNPSFSPSPRYSTQRPWSARPNYAANPPPFILQVHSEYNHPSISQMTRLISTEYYWRGMGKSIQRFVNSCHTCQIIKRNQRYYNKVLHNAYFRIERPHSAPKNSVIFCYLAVYNPQANGLIERMNATITGKLRLLYLENPKTSWTKLIKQVVQIYNKSPHTVTGFPPIILMYNSIPPELKNHYNPFLDVQKARQLAFNRTQLKHERDKQRYDKGHQAPHFEIGDLVLVKNYKHSIRENWHHTSQVRL